MNTIDYDVKHIYNYIENYLTTRNYNSEKIDILLEKLCGDIGKRIKSNNAKEYPKTVKAYPRNIGKMTRKNIEAVRKNITNKQSINWNLIGKELNSMATKLNNTSSKNENIIEVEIEPYEWRHNFGNGVKSYERIDYDGVSYIYDIDTKAYLGVLRINKIRHVNARKRYYILNTTIPDPTI